MRGFRLQKWAALCLAGLLLLGTGCSRSAAEPAPKKTSKPAETQQEIAAEASEPKQEQAEPEQPPKTETTEPEQTEQAEVSEETPEEAPIRIRESDAQEYGFLVEPLLSTRILEQEFSEGEAVELGEYDWYSLVSELGKDIPAVPGLDGRTHYDAQTVEDFLSTYFKIDAEQLRRSSSYSKETGTYVEPQEVDGFSPSARISGAKTENGTLVLVVDLYSEKDKVYNTSVLTLQVEQKDAEGEQSEEKTEEQTDPSLALTGWRYCSNHIIYHAESAEA